MPPESKSTAKEIQRKFGEVAVDFQKCNGQGEVVLLIVRLIEELRKQATRLRTLDNTGK